MLRNSGSQHKLPPRIIPAKAYRNWCTYRLSPLVIGSCVNSLARASAARESLGTTMPAGGNQVVVSNYTCHGCSKTPRAPQINDSQACCPRLLEVFPSPTLNAGCKHLLPARLTHLTTPLQPLRFTTVQSVFLRQGSILSPLCSEPRPVPFSLQNHVEVSQAGSSEQPHSVLLCIYLIFQSPGAVTVT